MLKADRIVSFVILIAAICITAKSLTFDLVHKGTPGPGFLPLLIGVTTILVVLAQIISSFKGSAKKNDSPNPLTRESFKPFVVFLGSAVVFVLATPVIGMLIPLGLMTGFTAWYFGAKKRITVILLAVLTPLLTYLIFTVALGVPMPNSLLGV